GLHPALKETMLPLWQKRQLAFVPFAGTDDLTRSHFETQDSMESGMPIAAPGAAPHSYGSGFLNRLAAALGNTAAPVSFTDGLPMVMTGDVVVPNVSLKGTGRAPFDDRQMGLLAGMYAGTRLEPLITAGFAEQMGSAWNRTVVVVLSEFGRTFGENGTHGTDHGHGSVHWVLGGAIDGGRFAGEQVAVTPQTLNQNRDFPVLTEYRGLLS